VQQRVEQAVVQRRCRGAEPWRFKVHYCSARTTPSPAAAASPRPCALLNAAAAPASAPALGGGQAARGKARGRRARGAVGDLAARRARLTQAAARTSGG
jgi:hypothetical protein